MKYEIYMKANERILTSGVNICLTPDPAPSRVTPRMKKMISTKYGNNAVKYTACGKKEQIY